MRLFSQFFPYTAMALGEAGDAPNLFQKLDQKGAAQGRTAVAVMWLCKPRHGASCPVLPASWA